MCDCNYATVYKGQLTLIVTKEEPDPTIWFFGNLTKKKRRVRESEITLIQKHGKGLQFCTALNRYYSWLI